MTRHFALGALLASFGMQAWAWDCSHEKVIDETLDLSDASELAVQAAAGELKINGRENGDEARIRGRVCASEEEWLEQAGIVTEAGERAAIRVYLPDVGNSWSWTGSRYVYLDLELEVPASLPLDVRDSSGDMRIEGVGALSVRDSSGEIEITDSTGPVTLEDSSGDVELRDIGGDVTVESDSSGELRGYDIEGTVLVRRDSSGDIHFRDVGEHFIVERDSSGDISADRVGGDFRVLRDGSGDIDADNVTGEVDIPPDKV